MKQKKKQIKKNNVMRFIFLSILILFSISSLAQKHGNLLLLKIDKERDLKIESKITEYQVIELDSSYLPLDKLNISFSKKVVFNNFTDNHLMACVKNDSIKLNTFYKPDTFSHEKEGVKNLSLIYENISKAKFLMEYKVKSLMYDQKIQISYLLISCNYCVGYLSENDGESIGYQGQIVMVIDDLKIDDLFKIDKSNMYEIIKQINFNSFTY